MVNSRFYHVLGILRHPDIFIEIAHRPTRSISGYGRCFSQCQKADLIFAVRNNDFLSL